jgi:ribosomal protein S18 acetylase RimI-like enzyme
VTDHDAGPATIRAGTTDDVAGALGLWVGAGAHPSSTDDAPSVTALVRRDPGALLVAEIDGRMVGTLIAAWDGWRGNMYRLAVLPDVRRRGIARALVRRGEQRLRALGCRRITALVVDADDHAVAFWVGAGYVAYPMERYVRTLGPALRDDPS